MIAVNQIGVAATLVNTLFMAIVGALALALGLAFGLGEREPAGQIVQGWYASSQRAAPKLAQAADAAGRQAQPQLSNARDGRNGTPPRPASRLASERS